MRNILAPFLLSLLLVIGCTQAKLEATPSPTATEVVAPLTDGSESTAEFEEIESTVTDIANGEELPRPRDVPFVPSPNDVVEAMLDLADVRPGDKVIDLGSGDGRIVIAAAERGATGVGIELDPALVRESEAAAEAQGVSANTEFRNGDLFEADLSGATVITMYLLPVVNERLIPKLLDELGPGTRIVSHSFDMGDWKPEQTVVVDGRTVHLWVVPPKDQRPEGY